MYELRLSIPEPSLRAELQPEVLGVKLLFLLRKRLESGALQNGSDLPPFSQPFITGVSGLGCWLKLRASLNSWGVR